MEISVKLFAYCFIIGILHCPNYAQANDEDLENFVENRLNAIRNTDPINRAIGRRYTIQRRLYNVKQPDHLWHVDSSHKLIN